MHGEASCRRGERQSEEAAAADELDVVRRLPEPNTAGGIDDVCGKAVLAVLDDREEICALGLDEERPGDARTVRARLGEPRKQRGEHIGETRAVAVDVSERKTLAAPRARTDGDGVESRALAHLGPPAVTSARSRSSVSRSKPAGERPPARKSELMMQYASSQ